ncbi:chaperone for protein-folding within the ER, fungal-domain-containing protein [Amylocystis lapponica]|nr:chaperone for protein-folding within the ER, fungal-domain-containing protein [Amylocystis lapponica]
MFFLTSALAFLLAAAPAIAQDIQYTPTHNATAIIGTWTSGSGHVLTGGNFASPLNMSFTYPNTTGISYSFTDDGYYEIARYRFTSNGTQPSCITGVMNWAHGEYTLNSNGSISMVPFGDGFQQIQDPCSAVSNFIQVYNDTEYYRSWGISLDSVLGYLLQLNQFDGTPLPPMIQYSVAPNMLPTRQLRNSTASLVVQAAFRVNAGERASMWSAGSVAGLVLVLAAAAMAV